MSNAANLICDEALIEVSTTNDGKIRPKQAATGPHVARYLCTGLPMTFLVQAAGAVSADSTAWVVGTGRARPVEIVRSANTYRLGNIKNELRRYTSLPENWDGEGSIAPPRKAASDAIAFLDLLPPNVSLPKPMVEADGELALYWKSQDCYLEIGFKGDDTVDYFGENEASGTELMNAEQFDGTHVNPDLIAFIRQF